MVPAANMNVNVKQTERQEKVTGICGPNLGLGFRV
jgi:hypothetical protein